MTNSTYFEQAIANIKIPIGILHWYQIEDQTIFPLYGASGGIAYAMTAILYRNLPSDGRDFGRSGVHADENGGKWFVIEVFGSEGVLSISNKIIGAMAALEEQEA